MTGLLSLPVELISLILQKCSFKDSLKAAQVCKALAEIVCGDVQLQYDLELAVSARARDTAPATLATPTRLVLDNLVHHLESRKKIVLHIEVDKTQELEGRNVDLYYSGGILLETLIHADNNGDNYSCQIMDLWSKSPSLRSWPFHIAYQSIAIQPSSDLFVGVYMNDTGGHCLDFLTLSTGEAYPQSLHAMSFPLEMDKYTVGQESLQIVDNTVACRFRREDEDGRIIEQRIITVNWEDGEILNNVIIDPSSSGPYYFLSKEHIMVAHLRRTGSIKVLPEIQIYEFHWDKPSSDEEFASDCIRHPTAIFLFPELTTPLISFRMKFSVSSPSAESSRHKGLYSRPVQGAKLIGIGIVPSWIRYHISSVRECTFFTPIATFTDYSQHIPLLNTEEKKSTIFIPWEHWGPSRTRCFDGSFSSWSIYGWRVVSTDYSVDRIIDFNPLDIARDICRATRSTKKSYQFPNPPKGFGDNNTIEKEVLPGLILHATLIPESAPFKEQIHTTLPYRESLLPRIVDVGSADRMILGEDLIHLQYRPNSINLISYSFH